MNDLLMDSVHVSSQLGRLDVVSALLAIVSLLIAIGGVFFFINIQNSARKKAKKVARIEMEQAKKEVSIIAEKVANEYMQKHGFSMIREYVDLVYASDIDNGTAERLGSMREKD